MLLWYNFVITSALLSPRRQRTAHASQRLASRRLGGEGLGAGRGWASQGGGGPEAAGDEAECIDHTQEPHDKADMALDLQDPLGVLCDWALLVTGLEAGACAGCNTHRNPAWNIF